MRAFQASHLQRFLSALIYTSSRSLFCLSLRDFRAAHQAWQSERQGRLHLPSGFRQFEPGFAIAVLELYARNLSEPAHDRAPLLRLMSWGSDADQEWTRLLQVASSAPPAFPPPFPVPPVYGQPAGLHFWCHLRKPLEPRSM